MKYFLDTEFMEDGRTIELISIGVVAEDGRQLYLESAEAQLEHANPFVQEHVLPKLGPVELRVSRAAIRKALMDLLDGDHEPVFVADCAAYDWICVCQLFGRMVDLPPGWPFYCLDLQQLIYSHPAKRLIRDWLASCPRPDSDCHHAYRDACWLAATWVQIETQGWRPPFSRVGPPIQLAESDNGV